MGVIEDLLGVHSGSEGLECRTALYETTLRCRIVAVALAHQTSRSKVNRQGGAAMPTPSASTQQSPETLSPWWPRTVAIVMVFGFAVLILLSLKAYQNAPPIPAKAVASNGEVVFTGDDVSEGQAVFLKYGLMNNGTIWGHGGYLGPDFSAQTLHLLALHAAGGIAQSRFRTAYASLRDPEKSAVDGAVAALFKTNRYDAAAGTVTLPIDSKAGFDEQVAYWTSYFVDPAKNGGLSANAVADPGELRQLTAFFVWTAWAAAAQRPGSFEVLYQQLPLRPVGGQPSHWQCGPVERHQPDIPARRHRRRAARLRQVRLSRVARRTADGRRPNRGRSVGRRSRRRKRRR